MAIDYGSMSVPGASSFLSGTDLSAALQNETEEQRRKRLLAQQQARLLPSAGVGGMSSLGLAAGGFGGGGFAR